MNLIEKAQKVITFRMSIAKECKKRGIAMPSDEKIAEYINSKGEMNVAKFMSDYVGKTGVFHEPITDFWNEINKFAWADGNKPTKQEVEEWTSKNGYDVSCFLREHTINSYEGFYRKTIEKVITLDDKVLIDLWNYFIEESAWYGEDSYIFDLADENDSKWLTENLDDEDIIYICRLVTENKGNVRFIQVLAKDCKIEDAIHVIHDAKGLIVAYWSDIVNRIMSFADLYYENCNEVMMQVFQPIIRDMCKVPYKENNM